MTFGTGLVISVATICVTFIIVCAIGANMQKKKQQNINDFTKDIFDEIRKDLDNKE